MVFSKEELIEAARETGFDPELLEKVWHLLILLDAVNRNPYLENRLALKGGTAINLFLFQLPRLSVDIDLNYIGSPHRDVMLSERPIVEAALELIFLSCGLKVLRIPHSHAGGKWRLKYISVLGGLGNLEVDLNFLARIPLWQTQKSNSVSVGGKSVQSILLMHFYELFAGKMAALFSRSVARDFFDMHQFCTNFGMEKKELRLACIIYGAMSSEDWRSVTVNSITADPQEVKSRLVPLLRKDHPIRRNWSDAAEQLIAECRSGITQLLFPLTESEEEFLRLLHEDFIINASLLTDDPAMTEVLSALPGLRWKVRSLQTKYMKS